MKKKLNLDNKITYIILEITFTTLTVIFILLSFYALITSTKQKTTHVTQGKFDQLIVTKNNIRTMYDLYDEIDALYEQKNELINDIRLLNEEKDELSLNLNSLHSEVIDKYVPSGEGTTKTYMGYYQNWTGGTKQSKLHSDVCNLVNFDEYGYAKLGERYFVAVKPYYGEVGDYLNIYLEDGGLIKCIIGDNKGYENSDPYIHYDGSILEFMVSSSFIGVKQTRPDFWQPITSIQNVGNYYIE